MKKNIPFFIFLLSIIFFSCKSKTENPKQKLLDAFAKQNIDSTWNFETYEDDSSRMAAFKNKNIREHISLPDKDTSVVIGFFSKEDKMNHSSTKYKAELFRRDSSLYIDITDPSDKQLDRIALRAAHKKQAVPSVAPAATGSFGSLNDCFYDFNCNQRSHLQCLANQMCQPVYADIDCCLPDGQCYAILVIIFPTRPLCSVISAQVPEVFARE